MLQDAMMDVEQYIQAIEDKHDVSVCAAWVVGSHAWETADADSDIDIRFVFTQPITAYISLTRYQKSIDTDSETLAAGVPYYAQLEDEDLELLGWNAFRFLELLADDNPSVIECLANPYTVRAHPVIAELAEYVNGHFNVIELFDHYQSLAKKTYKRYIESGDDPTVKRTLYAVRACLYAEYVRQTHSLPTLNFPEFIETAPECVRDGWEDKMLRALITMKTNGEGDVEIGNAFQDEIGSLLDFELEYQQHVRDEHIQNERLDAFMLRLIQSQHYYYIQ